ncbi:type 1 fimbrial protein [Enterobacter asburiae]|jgi:minor fimbrial subunit|uniref:fimbrial protein n=1 Tax=Enterobacter asburiae TaxID=61645 RepID=UPI00192ABC2D|nr:fimbrial protein [Enterobacter asburiae]MBL5913460.1 type 1 fimbrial protein [Enterobacter asburiae]MBL5917968.1 type 1 fimbrial protein [Enterobacter asburiae]HCH0657574.1 type 1 fimbrial protein [Enterobacter asburiae]
MHFRIIQALFITALISSFNLFAGDLVQINVTGNIIASPCHIDANNMTQNINLGDNLQTSDLQKPSSSTPWNNFSIMLTDCPEGTKQVVAAFHGTPDEDEPIYYKNVGTAKNIIVQLDTQGGGDVVSNGDVLVYPVTNGIVEYKLAARGYSKNGGVTPGTISSTITVDISYN